MKTRTDHIVYQWLAEMGVDQTIIQPLQLLVEVSLLIVLCYIADRIAKKVFVRIITSMIKKTKVVWDDVLLENKVFDRLAHLAPALVVQAAATYVFSGYPEFVPLVIRLAQAYMIVIVLLLVIGIFNTLEHYFKQTESLKDKPIDSYFQLAKLVAYFVGGVLVIAQVFDKDPQGILTALGALTAVSMLVFKDTILGFVASIQLSANDMIRVGDWVSMPKYGADGDVIKITLNTVKVQNWDKTISTIPTYSFVSDSFKNWRGMAEAGGRRIKRSVVLKSGSVQFCDQEMVSKLKNIQLITSYIETKVTEIDAHNSEGGFNKTYLVNGRHLTNIGVFRVYAQLYIESLEGIHPDLTRMVYQTEATQYGVPLQVYCFTKTTDWAAYENIQSDIFDHLYAAAPEFGLEVYQQPSGGDLKSMAK